MNRLLLRWLINAIGLYLAARLVPGIYFEGNVGVLLAVAFIFGLVNALLHPLAQAVDLSIDYPDVGIVHISHQCCDVDDCVGVGAGNRLAVRCGRLLAGILGRADHQSDQCGRQPGDWRRTPQEVN